MLSEDAYAYTSASDSPGLLPPNMRRDSSAGLSDSADSDVLLMYGNGYSNGHSGKKYRS